MNGNVTSKEDFIEHALFLREKEKNFKKREHYYGSFISSFFKHSHYFPKTDIAECILDLKLEYDIPLPMISEVKKNL